jgi:LPS-assembly protein
MKQNKIIISLCVLLLALFIPMTAGSSEVIKAGGITIWADDLSYDKEVDTYQAIGNVMIVWNGAILIADKATLNEATNEAVAEGRVRLVKGSEVLHSDRIKANLLTEMWEVTNGDLLSRVSNFHVIGQTIKKVGEDQYRIEHGTFTTCNGERPSWKFASSTIDVTLEDFAIGQNELFYIKDVPVLYFPYMLFPVNRERQSGFLFSHVGNSSKKGFNIDIPYYWAISPSQEATVDLDVESKRGAGIGVDYNYLRREDSLGKVHGYSIYDTSQDRFRGNLVTQQQEWFSPSFVARSDVNLVTDHTFFLDISEESGEYNRQIADSSVSLTKNWEKYSLGGEFRYVDNLYAVNNRDTLQKLPTINFTAVRQKMPGIPLFLALDSSFVDFYHDDGLKGQRIDIHPFATMYLPMPGGLEFSAWGGYHERLYNAYDAKAGETGNGSRGIGLVDAGATIATSFNRIYETHWGKLSRIRHTMVPELSYNFVEQKDQDSLPFFDYNDRVLGQSIASWSITNYLTGKYQEGDASPIYRDLFYLKLSQGYQFSGTRRELLTLVPDVDRSATDVRIEANFSPFKELSLFTDSRYNPNNTRFSTISTGFDFNDGKGNSTGLSYRYSRQQLEYLEGKLDVKLVKPFEFKYIGRYSIDKGGFLEMSYALEYKHQCWGVELTYHDRPVAGDHAFMINFTMAGIGPLGKLKAF